MSFETKLNNKYREIAQQVNDMIPEDWQEFYLYGENDNGGSVFFFYKNKQDKYIYSVDIPQIFKIDKDEYLDDWEELFDKVGELRELFINEGKEPWFSIMIHLTSEGELNVEFDYTNWDETDFGSLIRMIYFKKKYLGEEPTTESWKIELQELEKYITEKDR